MGYAKSWRGMPTPFLLELINKHYKLLACRGCVRKFFSIVVEFSGPCGADRRRRWKFFKNYPFFADFQQNFTSLPCKGWTVYATGFWLCMPWNFRSLMAYPITTPLHHYTLLVKNLNFSRPYSAWSYRSWFLEYIILLKMALEPFEPLQGWATSSN